MRDPPLTQRGFAQCQELSQRLHSLPYIDDNTRVLVSPMRRTLQTVRLGLDFLISRGVPVEVSPDWTETSTNPCDVGSTLEALEVEFPDFNFDQVYPEWPLKTGKYAFTQSAIAARGLECRLYMKSRPEKVIIAVSHADFLHGGICSTIFRNAEYRIFDFIGDSGELKERVDAKHNDRYRRASFS